MGKKGSADGGAHLGIVAVPVFFVLRHLALGALQIFHYGQTHPLLLETAVLEPLPVQTQIVHHVRLHPLLPTALRPRAVLLPSSLPPTVLLPPTHALLRPPVLLSVDPPVFISHAAAAGEEGAGPEFAFEALARVGVGGCEVVDAFFKLFLNVGFPHDFFVELEVEFDVEGGSFGGEAADEGVVDHVGRGADLRFQALRFLLTFIMPVRRLGH